MVYQQADTLAEITVDSVLKVADLVQHNVDLRNIRGRSIFPLFFFVSLFFSKPFIFRKKRCSLVVILLFDMFDLKLDPHVIEKTTLGGGMVTLYGQL